MKLTKKLFKSSCVSSPSYISNGHWLTRRDYWENGTTTFIHNRGVLLDACGCDGLSSMRFYDDDDTVDRVWKKVLDDTKTTTDARLVFTVTNKVMLSEKQSSTPSRRPVRDYYRVLESASGDHRIYVNDRYVVGLGWLVGDRCVSVCSPIHTVGLNAVGRLRDQDTELSVDAIHPDTASFTLDAVLMPIRPDAEEWGIAGKATVWTPAATVGA
jgi:hypothetical protein